MCIWVASVMFDVVVIWAICGICVIRVMSGIRVCVGMCVIRVIVVLVVMVVIFVLFRHN